MMYIENLIYQPFYQCNNKCKQCYLKGRQLINRPDCEQIIRTATQLSDLLRTQEITTNHFVLSINTHPLSDNEQLGEILDYMCNILNSYGTHITLAVHNEFDLLNVHRHIFPFLHRIAISQLSKGNMANKVLQYFSKEKGKLIYPRKTVILNTMKLKEKPPAIIDTTHLIFRKNSLGELQSPSNLEEYKQLLTFVRKNGVKFVEDRCIVDSIIYKRRLNNHRLACQADQILNIWPDGNVSRCPYDIPNAKSANLAQNISSISNIIKIDDHPMNRCKMKELENLI